MIVVRTLQELREARRSLPEPLGLVPTMGALHAGHLSLAQRAVEENASVAASIFVNPTQFSPSEDLEAYPRDLEGDLAALQSNGVDLVWTPSVQEVYPPGFQTWVSVEQVTRALEGAQRPEHFRGVTTVVAKLFLAFQPQRAYFGQKDAQQAVVIRRMVEDLNFPLEIVVCPIVREADGLALSSRNVYLDHAQRQAAPVLQRALQRARRVFQDGQLDADALRQAMLDELQAEPLARTQYVSAADPLTLEELQGPVEHALLSMAVYFGKTRLIDNLLIGNEDD